MLGFKLFPPLLLLCGLPVSAAQSPPMPTFTSATRLVQIDVVVRDKNGPVKGLTKDDFTIYDYKVADEPWNRKQQPIQLFQSPEDLLKAAAASQGPSTPLAPGAVSNRGNSGGLPVAGAIVILVDQLNTPFDLKGYMRLFATKVLKDVMPTGNFAMYSLGKNLHAIQDLSIDPQKLMDALANIDSGDMYLPPDSKDEITLSALKAIAQQLSGIPGRKNLVWLKPMATLASRKYNEAKMRAVLRDANIALYPVLVRTLGTKNAFRAMENQHLATELGASLGGTAFSDASDITLAVQTAQEDSSGVYTLGFYPAASDLDGKPHKLVVELSKEALKRGFDLEYRSEYLASPKPPDAAKPEDLFDSPLDATSIALTATSKPDAAAGKAGRYQIEVTADLAGIQLEHRGDRWEGSIKMAVRLERPSKQGVDTTKPLVQTIPISLDERQHLAAQTRGFRLPVPVDLKANAGALRVVVQDATSGAMGSLRVPLGKR